MKLDLLVGLLFYFYSYGLKKLYFRNIVYNLASSSRLLRKLYADFEGWHRSCKLLVRRTSEIYHRTRAWNSQNLKGDVHGKR